jgi:hypothetical protein
MVDIFIDDGNQNDRSETPSFLPQVTDKLYYVIFHRVHFSTDCIGWYKLSYQSDDDQGAHK